MKKIISKLSLRNECALVLIGLNLLLLILYLLYCLVLKNFTVYQNHIVLFHLMYWLIMISVDTILSIILIDSITSPIKAFIGYLKEFQNIDFEKVEKGLGNADYKKLSIALGKLQKELFQAIFELEEKNKEITLLVEEQKRDFSYKKNLISSISHDIKTPLTIIHATISAFRDGIFPQEDLQKELDNIIVEIEKTTKMLQHTISIFKMDNEIELYEKKPFGLIDTITKSTDNFKKLFEKYNQTLILNLQKDITIMGDQEKFTRAINNLIMNAIIYSPPGEKIEINLIQNAKNDILEIINTGITISDDDMPHIFDPFYRADKSRTKTNEEGNGLGLYIAKEIMRKHRFELNAINLDNAVKFYIVMPHNKNLQK